MRGGYRGKPKPQLNISKAGSCEHPNPAVDA